MRRIPRKHPRFYGISVSRHRNLHHNLRRIRPAFSLIPSPPKPLVLPLHLKINGRRIIKSQIHIHVQHYDHFINAVP
jgi:hypothetical protein